MRRIKPILLSIGALVVGGIVSFVLLSRLQPHLTGTDEASTSLVDRATLDKLPKKSGSQAYVKRLPSNILPPTDSWLSGMVLQDTPLPVFPMPLSFLAKKTGFEIGLPNVRSSKTVISGGHTPGVSVAIDSATDFTLSRYDKVSAALSYRNGTKALGTVTVAQGSPYAFYRASDTTTLTITGMGTTTKDISRSYLRYNKDGHDYAIAATQGATIAMNGATASITTPKGSLVTTYGLPSGKQDHLREFAGNEVRSVAVSNSQKDAKSLTTFEYNTANNRPTVVAPMSYNDVVGKGAAVATYDSIYGPMTATKGNRVTIAAPLVTASNALDLSSLTATHKQQLIKSLKTDVAGTSITATDSYFAGKQLARAATLLDISEQLGQTETSSHLKAILREGFSKRLGADYFYYDSKLKGIAAQNKAFGSEDFNDHHFHYGYFIYAASIFGRYDADFMQQHQKQINLLVADIASYDTSNDFPAQRHYDPYAAHSWAAGLAPFTDGNNQESSSEALNAWNGVVKWSQLTRNARLETSAQWMLAGEAATARSAWRSVDTDSPVLKNYASPLASLSFGGKRTYSTFFSDEANIKLAIQLLPLSPVMTSFASDRSRIDKQVDASIRDDNFNVALGDYILMYQALSDPHKAARLLSGQQDKFIDDGNSRTYMQAWVFTLADR